MTATSKRRYFVVPDAKPADDSRTEQSLIDEQATVRKSRNRWHEQKADPYEGDAPVDTAVVAKYRHGPAMKLADGIKTKFHRKKFEKHERRAELSSVQAARGEILLHEEAGYIEPDPGQSSATLRQNEIARAVDVASAAKYFNLELPKYGPYRANYTRNGRHLLLGGTRGHVAAFDWMTKQLHCELNVMEHINDVQWLHIETMFAVAQARWTYIYDNQGVELHCLKSLFHCLRLEFLPYHFLLAACTETSYLHWLDVSIGKLVQSFPVREGRLDVMCQNPANAVLALGHAKGTVSMWSPNVKEPLVKMLCHPTPVRGLSINGTGTYMATTGGDRCLKIWDLRAFKPLFSYKLPVGAAHVAFSQRNILATAVGTTVQIFRDACTSDIVGPYLSHDTRSMVTDVMFCPFEDVLGVGHQSGFTSLLVPGAGEPNIDALEANPYQSKRQRREFEVKALLDKIQPEMITLENNELLHVDESALEDKLEARQKILYIKPEKIEFKPRHKAKGRSKASRVEKRKQGVQEAHRRALVGQKIEMQDLFFRPKSTQVAEEDNSNVLSVLDRFKRKTT